MTSSRTVKETDRVLEFWNEQAGLGRWAGTRDLIAKELEMGAIASYVRDGMRVLDVGCGNGVTAIEIARRFKADVLGIDFSPEMIEAAKLLAAGQQLKGSVDFRVGDVRNLPDLQRDFDLVYTERMVINLSDWPAQRQAIEYLTSLARPGGAYVMCENSQDGLNRLNELRDRVGLGAIEPPWHNRYLRDDEVLTAVFRGVTLDHVNDYSATYYFLSRVVNAALAARDGVEPSYDSPVNEVALKLPAFGGCGQGRIWLWRRTDARPEGAA